MELQSRHLPPGFLLRKHRPHYLLIGLPQRRVTRSRYM